MLESPVRPEPSQPKKPQPKKSRFVRVKRPGQPRFTKHYRLAALILFGSFGCLALYYLAASFNTSNRTQKPSALIGLRSLSADARQNQLVSLIELPERGLSALELRDRHRAHYLAAADLIQQGKGKQALVYLQGLGKEYPLLRPQILFKIAQAYKQIGRSKETDKTLSYLIDTYPQHPLAANALSLLSENISQQEKRIIADFPYHPIAQNIARRRLRHDSSQYQLLLLLAKYSREPNLNPIRDRLVLEYPAELTPDDWEAIADGYWREGEHRKAADAYSFATPIPRNLYRVARGFHRNGNLDTAHRAYQRLLREYHDSREAGQALIYLASISSGDEAVVYLEKAIAKFPHAAPEAYRSKAIVHEKFDKYEAAGDSRQKLLEHHSDSASAAEYRWGKARQLAAKGNEAEAWSIMQPVVGSNRELEFGAKALYSTGQWAKQIGKPGAARQTWTKIIKLYPQSYWAWRAAVQLGWQVGDFDRLRPISPALDLAETYRPLPFGSAALQELYLLGQNRDAWLLLQSEIESPQQISVDEQFTEGVLRLALGQYSQGMQQVWELSERENPQDLARWRALRKTKTYWHSLFPFPYQTQILQNSSQSEINPLLSISVMRKESTFNPTIDSVVGAVGLMQIVPPTAEWAAEQIGMNEYSLTNPDDNIKIGTWYLAHNHNRYQDDSLLAVASYNAGTGNVNAWLERYDLKNRDRFVEQIPFPETKDYVEGVFGNYWNYLRLYNPEIRRQVEDLRRGTKSTVAPSK